MNTWKMFEVNKIIYNHQIKKTYHFEELTNPTAAAVTWILEIPYIVRIFVSRDNTIECRAWYLDNTWVFILWRYNGTYTQARDH